MTARVNTPDPLNTLGMADLDALCASLATYTQARRERDDKQRLLDTLVSQITHKRQMRTTLAVLRGQLEAALSAGVSLPIWTGAAPGDAQMAADAEALAAQRTAANRLIEEAQAQAAALIEQARAQAVQITAQAPAPPALQPEPEADASAAGISGLSRDADGVSFTWRYSGVPFVPADVDLGDGATLRVRRMGARGAPTDAPMQPDDELHGLVILLEANGGQAQKIVAAPMYTSDGPGCVRARRDAAFALQAGGWQADITLAGDTRVGNARLITACLKVEAARLEAAPEPPQPKAPAPKTAGGARRAKPDLSAGADDEI